jgi:hypothetical protein
MMFTLTQHKKSSVIVLSDGYTDLSEPKRVAVNKLIKVLCMGNLIHVLEKWKSCHFYLITLRDYMIDVGSHSALLCVFSLSNHVTWKSPQFDGKVFSIMHNFGWFG